MGSHLIADCTADQTNVGGFCYHTTDLDVLVAFATNSGLSTEYGDVIGMCGGEPAGAQQWTSGRLTYLGCYGGELSGAIPSDIGNLTELTQLFIFNSS